MYQGEAEIAIGVISMSLDQKHLENSPIWGQSVGTYSQSIYGKLNVLNNLAQCTRRSCLPQYRITLSIRRTTHLANFMNYPHHCSIHFFLVSVIHPTGYRFDKLDNIDDKHDITWHHTWQIYVINLFTTTIHNIIYFQGLCICWIQFLYTMQYWQNRYAIIFAFY